MFLRGMVLLYFIYSEGSSFYVFANFESVDSFLCFTRYILMILLLLILFFSLVDFFLFRCFWCVFVGIDLYVFADLTHVANVVFVVNTAVVWFLTIAAVKFIILLFLHCIW